MFVLYKLTFVCEVYSVYTEFNVRRIHKFNSVCLFDKEVCFILLWIMLELGSRYRQVYAYATRCSYLTFRVVLS